MGEADNEVVDADALPVALVAALGHVADDGRDERTTAWSYLSSRLTPAYRSVLTVVAARSVDLSAAEISDALAEGEYPLEPDAVEGLCKQLVAWGNLLTSPRQAKVRSLEEWNRQRQRYQMTRLGALVHQTVELVLARGDVVREVSRDLLPEIVAALQSLASNEVMAPTALSGKIRTLFLQHRNLVESMREFEAALGETLRRVDLDPDEYRIYKSYLVQYLETTLSDLLRHQGPLVRAVEVVHALVPNLIAAANDGTIAELDRGPGFSLADWDDLAGFYAGSPSGIDDFQGAAQRFMGRLLANYNRIVSSAGRVETTRADLLHLAGWFDGCVDDDSARRLFDAATGLYSCRHLSGVAQDADGRTSWWTGPAATVAVSLRAQGDRSARGSVSRADDHSTQKAMLLELRRLAMLEQKAVVSELAAGTLTSLSPGAQRLLASLISSALGSAGPDTTMVEASDPARQVVVTVERKPGSSTTVISKDGAITYDGLSITARPAVHAGGQLVEETG